ncbi:MAG TPA: 50S ribosomal protein L10 [Solirubrobacteraceae bacterium]|nr:50S ribosomal protein L10 [Solirubrobacteraceae bacterium]
MNREQKAAAIAEIAENIRESDAVFAVDYRGISVPQAAELRTRLRGADARFAIVKNTLTERAADEAGAESLKELLEGPTALTYVRGDAAAAAKALRDYGRETELLPFKGGYMDGNPLTAEDIGAIARLPSRDVLYAQLVGIVAHPIAGLARTMNQLIGGLAVALGQIAEKGLVPAEGAAPAAEPEAASDDAPEAASDDAPDAASDDASDDSTEAAPAGEEAAEAPTEAAVEPTDAAEETTPEESAPDADATAEDDPDAGPASGPEPAQPDQAEGDDAPEETS